MPYNQHHSDPQLCYEAPTLKTLFWGHVKFIAYVEVLK